MRHALIVLSNWMFALRLNKFGIRIFITICFDCVPQGINHVRLSSANYVYSIYIYIFDLVSLIVHVFF